MLQDAYTQHFNPDQGVISISPIQPDPLARHSQMLVNIVLKEGMHAAHAAYVRRRVNRVCRGYNL